MQIDTRKLKKLIIKAVPYVAFSYVGNLIGFAYRTAEGDGFQEKILPFMSNLGVAFARIFPSLHPFDLLFGLVLAGVMRLVLYVKSKNRKKFRQGEEYGSAVWGGEKDIEPYMDLSCPENNVILTRTESLTMGKPSAPKFARNKNILVIGGSGSGKTRFFVKPNLMQMHSSYVVTDPKGTVLVECGKMLERGRPKRVDGKVVYRRDDKGNYLKDKKGRYIPVYEPYKIKVFNTIEGGAACFSDDSLVNTLNDMKNFGIRGPESVVFAGGNAKMNEFQAAMGICNLRHLAEEIGKRKKVDERYRQHLEGIKGIKLCQPQKDVEPNYGYFPVVFDGYAATRDEIYARLGGQGIAARKYFYPLTNSFECYKDYPTAGQDKTPVAAFLADRILTLPLYADLAPQDVDRICKIILECGE